MLKKILASFTAGQDCRNSHGTLCMRNRGNPCGRWGVRGGPESWRRGNRP